MIQWFSRMTQDQPGKRRLEDPKKENHLKQRLVEHIFYRVILELE
jgi:hypothetical protein